MNCSFEAAVAEFERPTDTVLSGFPEMSGVPSAIENRQATPSVWTKRRENGETNEPFNPGARHPPGVYHFLPKRTREVI